MNFDTVMRTTNRMRWYQEWGKSFRLIAKGHIPLLYAVRNRVCSQPPFGSKPPFCSTTVLALRTCDATSRAGAMPSELYQTPIYQLPFFFL